MASKKRRQTMDKLQREQTVKRRRAEKLEKKEAAKLAKAAGLLAPEAPVGLNGDGEAVEAPEPGEAGPTDTDRPIS